MNKQIEEMAQTLAEASRFAGKILVEETRAFVEEYHKYHSQNDFDKCHSKTVHELEAEYLHGKGYCKASDVAREIVEFLFRRSKALQNTFKDNPDSAQCFRGRFELENAATIIANEYGVELKKKYESEGKR